MLFIEATIQISQEDKLKLHVTLLGDLKETFSNMWAMWWVMDKISDTLGCGSALSLSTIPYRFHYNVLPGKPMMKNIAP